MKTTNKAMCGLACSGVLALCGALCVTFFGMRAETSQAESVDGAFVADAASSGMAEVKLGQLAQQKGWNTAVKDFSKRMEADHTKAGNELKDVADRNNVTLPNEVNYADKSTYERLSAYSGKEFDKAYADQMVKDHEKAVAEFKKEASEGENKDLKNFAAQTVPTLESHLQMAQDMKKTVDAE